MISLSPSFQAEPEGFSHFHLYVCAAFLVRWRKEILEERDFQVMCTQDTGGAVNLLTQKWDTRCTYRINHPADSDGDMLYTAFYLCK